MNALENPARFQADHAVTAEIDLQDAWIAVNTKMKKWMLSYLVLQFIVGLLFVSVSKAVANISGTVALSMLLVLTIATGVLFYELSERSADKRRPGSANLSAHMRRLHALDRLTGVHWEGFLNKPRFAERVVTPYRAAYRAGCVELIKLQHGEESKQWYEKYRELYIVAHELKLLPSDIPAEPETYEQIDDSVHTK